MYYVKPQTMHRQFDLRSWQFCVCVVMSYQLEGLRVNEHWIALWEPRFNSHLITTTTAGQDHKLGTIEALFCCVLVWKLARNSNDFERLNFRRNFYFANKKQQIGVTLHNNFN